MDERSLLTRFEVTRIVGLRSLQLSEGESPTIHIEDNSLREDTMYVAALELSLGKLNVRVSRQKRSIDVSKSRLPSCLNVFLDSRDGGRRSY